MRDSCEKERLFLRQVVVDDLPVVHDEIAHAELRAHDLQDLDFPQGVLGPVPNSSFAAQSQSSFVAVLTFNDDTSCHTSGGASFRAEGMIFCRNQGNCGCCGTGSTFFRRLQLTLISVAPNLCTRPVISPSFSASVSFASFLGHPQTSLPPLMGIASSRYRQTA